MSLGQPISQMMQEANSESSSSGFGQAGDAATAAGATLPTAFSSPNANPPNQSITNPAPASPLTVGTATTPAPTPTPAPAQVGTIQPSLNQVTMPGPSLTTPAPVQQSTPASQPSGGQNPFNFFGSFNNPEAMLQGLFGYGGW